MPYELRGNKVVKSSTGEVVKDHGSDHAKAVRHLRALKANVEEAAPVVLGALLEGFDARSHPRGWHGRWVRGRGGKPGRLEGSYNGVKLERGVAYQGRLATGEIHTGMWTGKLTGRGVDDPQAHPEFRHVDTGAVRTFQGGEFFGKLSDVKPAAASGGGSAFDPVTALGREGAAARGRGASAMASEHADTRDKLTSLPMGKSYGLHGPMGQVGRVDRTASGWEVYAGGESTPKVHKTPSSAAGHAMRIQRQAAATRTDVSARNYRGVQEVRAMNARQSQMAAAERLRSEMDRHGGFKIGDVVTHETGSREAGGHGPVTFTKQPGMSTVVGLQRNGNLRIKDPRTGTTHDVHHSHAQKVNPLHPDYRGKVVQDAYEAQRAELARQKAERARRSGRALSESEVLGVLLEGEHDRVQEAIGSVEKGAFHRWLGKKEDEPITDADIQRGLKAGGKAAKMAQFAKASRKWGK